ncbi:efflux RND transporter periplasmic adaptor subunit [Bowmanella yangjiangensis]|uniref:Efflux RND transporter periplasmic adaptor subunit n=1 Tax=Bowmanella yangjiangensis TaxID=2811230 RepID=A0ABS3CWU4_9ALTE|nr:efflux RND transporter periplasmic adaptor subunit [Bowmanella yangjiangensis]MBN7821599.1 efflux RND transporter periplasmic adaptor subunit [Bowmanella yangjiangensis]
MSITDTSGQDVLLAPKASRKKTYLIITGLILTSATLLLFPTLNQWSSAQASIPLQRLRLADVVQGDFVRDLSVQAQVVAAVSPRLYSPAQGTISFSVDAGAQVEKGQELASIDSPELTNELKQEESSLQKQKMELDRKRIQAKIQHLENQKSVDMANVSLVAAEREKRRADKAYASATISQIDFEKAQDELENARLVHQHAVQDAKLDEESLAFEIRSQQLQVDRQQLLVADLQRKVDELTLRSPVKGIVGNLAVQDKNQVTRHQAILSVVDLSQFELEVSIPESYADDLAIGMDAQVNFNGETHPATLVTLSPEIENNQVTGRVRFAASTPKGLRQNQRLTTRILMENKTNVLMVQRGQFLESGNGTIAYVVRDGMAKRQRIETGARSLSSVEILAGLQAGDTIIVSGTEQFDGAEWIQITN